MGEVVHGTLEEFEISNLKFENQNSKIENGISKFKKRNSRSEIRKAKQEYRNSKSEIREAKFENRNWKMEIRKWKLAGLIERCWVKREFRASGFYSPVSPFATFSFHLPVPCLEFPSCSVLYCTS
jgi:hypothetical protein